MAEMAAAGRRATAVRLALCMMAAITLAGCVPDAPTNPGTTTTTTPGSSTTTRPLTTTTTPGGGSAFVYVGDSTLGVIRKIDTATLATVETINVGSMGWSIALTGNRLFYVALA